mmetsp:Transcript_40726/g.95654  ORF Transcript_40726/g.95654 Transcript_40726/m.95654 type:complete len:156 (+) Transcript_40726:222-689(+)
MTPISTNGRGEQLQAKDDDDRSATMGAQPTKHGLSNQSPRSRAGNAPPRADKEHARWRQALRLRLHKTLLRLSTPMPRITQRPPPHHSSATGKVKDREEEVEHTATAARDQSPREKASTKCGTHLHPTLDLPTTDQRTAKAAAPKMVEFVLIRLH